MSALVHDGSFPGFLCAVAEALNARILDPGAPAPAVRGGEALEDLFAEAQVVPRSDERARRVLERLEAKAGADAARALLEAFCSDVPGADGAAAAVAVRLWFEGIRVLDELGSPEVALFEKAARRTAKEAHRFLGFVRFSELADGSWYARIRPDCDVLALIADHFAERFPLMRWVIHDGRRGTAVLHQKGREWLAAADFRVEGPGALPLSESEEVLRRAWKRYFDSVAIGGRTNSRLQAHFAPHKHRAELTEFAAST